MNQYRPRATADEFRAWLVTHDACEEALDWLDEQPGQSPEAIWETCPRGDWLLWWHDVAGTPAGVLTPVTYRAADRAIRTYASAALDRAGLSDPARRLLTLDAIADATTAAAAAEAAAKAAVRDAAWIAAGAASVAELRRSADDCRALLPMPAA